MYETCNAAPTEFDFRKCFIVWIIVSAPSGCGLEMVVIDLVSFMFC